MGVAAPSSLLASSQATRILTEPKKYKGSNPQRLATKRSSVCSFLSNLKSLLLPATLLFWQTFAKLSGADFLFCCVYKLSRPKDLKVVHTSCDVDLAVEYDTSQSIEKGKTLGEGCFIPTSKSLACESYEKCDTKNVHSCFHLQPLQKRKERIDTIMWHYWHISHKLQEPEFQSCISLLAGLGYFNLSERNNLGMHCHFYPNRRINFLEQISIAQNPKVQLKYLWHEHQLAI